MTKPMQVVLGLDGGGTKTRCVVVPSGKSKQAPATQSSLPGRVDFIPPPILGHAEAGSTNWNSVGTDRARQNCGQAIMSALAEAEYAIEDVGMLAQQRMTKGSTA